MRAAARPYRVPPGAVVTLAFVDDVAMRIPELQGSTRIPPSQLGPG